MAGRADILAGRAYVELLLKDSGFSKGINADGALLERVEALLNEPAEKPEPQSHDGWFREQGLLTFERRRAEREARDTHITHRNHDWRPAQQPRW